MDEGELIMSVYDEQCPDYDLAELFGMVEFASLLTYLQDELGIKVKEYDDRVVLNYSQIDTPKQNPLARECRGLIVEKVETNVGVRGRAICRPFHRFFNWGEALEVPDYRMFDINNSVIKEKVDGSLIKLYRDKDSWHFATRGTAFGEATMMDGRTFRQAIEDDVLGVDVYDEDFQYMLDSLLYRDHTYLFEFVSPLNQIVTYYPTPQLVLLDAICVDGESIPSHVIHKGEVKAHEHLEAVCLSLDTVASLEKKDNRKNQSYVRMAKAYYPPQDDKALKEWLESLHPTDEGFVAHDLVTDTRFKFKNDDYVNLHHIRGEGIPSFKRVLKLYTSNEFLEVVTYFQQLRPLIDEVVDELAKVLEKADTFHERHKQTEDQKAFALAVKDAYSGAATSLFFQARKKQSYPSSVFFETDSESQLEKIGKALGIERAYERGLQKMIEQTTQEAS